MMSNYDDALRPGRVPARISFEPTINCNLRCPMCDRTHKADFEKHRDEQLPCETVKSFLHEAGRHGTRSFLFIGGGEPLTDPHIIEYMQILKSYGVYVHLWTNGTRITEENDPLLSSYCDMITVSLDSIDPAVNDRARGVPGATERTIAGIRLLRKNSSRLFLRTHTVISALNIDHLKDFADFAAENGVNEIGGALMTPFPFVPDYMRFSREQVGNIGIRLEELCEYARAKGVALAGWYANTSVKMTHNLRIIYRNYTDHQMLHTSISCMALWGQATVRPNGDVAVCCNAYKPVLGNLHQNSLEEIWHSPRAMELREAAKRGEYLDAPCIGCDSGDPAYTMALEQTGNLEDYLTMSFYAR